MPTYRPLRVIGALIALFTLLAVILTAGAEEPAPGPFENTWARTDRPVLQDRVDRTWIWAPEAFTGVLLEPYKESPDGQREVQYFDKARMEITYPDSDQSSPWYVTNGLLVLEMVEGYVQLGDTARVSREPSNLPVAGDLDATNAPTYRTVSELTGMPQGEEGATVIQRVDQNGTVTEDESLAQFGVTLGPSASDLGREQRTASVFWEFMVSSGTIWNGEDYVTAPLFENPYFATGLPIAPPYWTTVSVGGTPEDVLFQCFERRCLTYTPGNAEGWQVEAGNVGLHYFRWRYPDGEPTPAPTATATATSTATATQTAVETPGDADNPAVCLNATEERFLTLINDYRAEHGLDELEVSAAINVAAYNHSLDMSRNDYFSHTSLNGDSPWERMEEAGYDYNTAMGENIAAGYPSAEAVFEGWMNSPGHNQNMLEPDFDVIGIGYVSDGHYWTTDFGGYVDAPPDC